MRLDAIRSPFACPVCETGLGLPRHAAHIGTDRWPVGLRCHGCGHEWDVTRGTVEGAESASPSGTDRAWRPLVATSTVMHPIAACRHCAGLMSLDVVLDVGQATCASAYTCPHCGAAGEVVLPGAVVRHAGAIGAVRAAS
jgi:hypothetical protein